MAVKWTEGQQRVIESRNRNLLVSAAAGSGKTAVLVERIIRMITEGTGDMPPLDIDHLLVMTFTSAAASEMRERIGAAVEQRLKEEPGNEHLWLQASLIPQAQIMTIDSFCLNLIRNHYSRLDIDPAFRIGDEGELSLLQGDVLGEVLEERYSQESEEFASFVENFGRGRSDKRVEELVLQTWQFSQSHPWPGEWLAACRAELTEGTIQELDESPWMRFLLADAARQLGELAAQMEDALAVCREENGPLAYEPMLLNDISRLRELEKTAGEGSYERFFEGMRELRFDRLAAVRGKEIDGEKKTRVTSARDRVKKAAARLRDACGQQTPEEVEESLRGTGPAIGVLLDLTEEFDAAYRAAKRERNVLDFNDLEHLALEVLYEKGTEGAGEGVSRRLSPAADELSRRFEEILVDEYQDSNYVQEALIAGISRERFGHPNVFMVGDVKQSIYRFRLARPELFMEKYDQYSREDSSYQMIELRQNFRSRKSVLDSVNDLFYQIMTKNLGGIRYTEETALYPGAVYPEPAASENAGTWGTNAQAGTPTELLLADAKEAEQLDEEAADLTARELEARMAAIRIRELTSQEAPLLVWDKALKNGQGAYRPVRYSDITILLRSMAGWSEIFVSTLMNEGIPARAQTKSGYFNTVEVETVLSLLAVLDNPMQDIPLAAVLRSPVIGMSDEEMAWMMAAYKKNAGKGQSRGIYGAWEMWRTGAGDETETVPAAWAVSIRRKLADLERLVGSLRRQSRYLPIHELLYRVYEESGYYEYICAMPAGETRRANLDMLVEKAAAYEQTSYKGLFHFVRYIERLRKFDTDFGEASLSGGQENTVRIMSIHKSKGLEFPVVILAGLGKRFNRQDASGQILLDADLGVAADYLDLTLRVKMTTLKKQAFKRRMELETMGEELRILYVAMTRAKEKLIMTAAVSGLEGRLEKWKGIPLTEGQIPYTILGGAGSALDWVLMADGAAGLPHMRIRQVRLEALIKREAGRQAGRERSRDALAKLDARTVWDPLLKEELDEALSYRYPFEEDTGLYAMLSVSEIKKQSQIGSGADEDEAVERLGPKEEPWEAPAGQPGEASDKASGRALRGTAYHRVFECLSFAELHSLEETKAALARLRDEGYLEQEAWELVRPWDVWTLLRSPLGRRMAAAQEEGRLYRERPFMIGVPARALKKGQSEELVLIQGVIDAWLEEPDGLVLIDYKTDYVPKELEEEGEELLRKRYQLQLDYYARALTQLTGKPVKEMLLYSTALGRTVPLTASQPC